MQCAFSIVIYDHKKKREEKREIRLTNQVKEPEKKA